MTAGPGVQAVAAVDTVEVEARLDIRGLDGRVDDVVGPVELTVRTKQSVRGDGVARAPLAAAAPELALMAGAVTHKLWPADEAVAICPVGGLFRAGDLILEPLRAALRALASAASIEPARFPPVLGGVLLALQSIDAVTDADVLAALDAACDQVQARKA